MSYVYVHDLDPFVFQLTEQFGLRWYGFAYMLGFFAGYYLLIKQIDWGWCRLDRETAPDLLLTVALAGVFGGRLGYVFLYGLEFLAEDPLMMIRIWEGGMSIHGGVIGAVLGIAVFAWQSNTNFWDLTDTASLCTPPGLFFGRIANFINGELWGRPTDGSWGVIFPRAPAPVGEGHVPRHPSQLYEACLEGLLLFMVLWYVRLKWDKTGRASVTFLVGYGVFRFIVEFFRAPDPHLGYELAGMTRGQIYSLLFVLAGLAVMFGVQRYPRFLGKE